MHPRLTIGIPTLDRPALLRQAIGSALAQTHPAVVVVADQGGTEGTAEVMAQYAGHPLVRHVATEGHAGSLQGNWQAAAEACTTEFFAWLQDDDVVAPHFARRVAQAFDAFPQANAYLARLAVSHDGKLASWWQGTGPMLPMDLIHGQPSLIRNSLLVTTAYVNSMCLSPGFAFRATPAAIEALRRVPAGVDLYAERAHPVEAACGAPAICDPAVVGYWVQHEGNESRAQVQAGGNADQYPRFLAYLDERFDALDGTDWESAFGGYALMAGRPAVERWVAETSPFRGHSKRLSHLLDLLKAFAPQPGDDTLVPAEAEPEKPKPKRGRKAC